MQGVTPSAPERTDPVTAAKQEGAAPAAGPPEETPPPPAAGSGTVPLVWLALLAFLLASAPARNTDLWSHLALGRALADGTWRFGADPFVHAEGRGRLRLTDRSFAAAGAAGLPEAVLAKLKDMKGREFEVQEPFLDDVQQRLTEDESQQYENLLLEVARENEPLIAHSWLYDLTTYGLYHSFGSLGGAALIVFRGVVLVVLAILLYRLASSSGGTVLPAACVGLSLVAMSVRVELRPVIISYLFLGMTLWFLERARQRREKGKELPWLRAYWPLLVLFALWVNVDEWFLLGPLTVLLYLVGEMLRPSHRPKELQGLALLLVAGTAACLVSPWHLYALSFPSDLGLSGAAAVLMRDRLLRALFVAPHDPAYWQRSAIGQSVAGLAWMPLVLLGLVSFLLNPQGLRSWRGPVWLGFGAILYISARAVPFFAVVSAPIMALNFIDFLRRRPAPASDDERKVNWPLLGRALAVPFGLFLLLAAWPGWLQSKPFGRRTWTVVVDPSLEKAAQRVKELSQKGALRQGSRAFNFSLETANVLAWLAPEERAFFSGHDEVAADDFRMVRASLLDRDLKKARHRAIFRTRKIDHLILYDTDVNRLAKVVEFFMLQPAEYPLLALDGHVAIFGWRDPENLGRFTLTDRSLAGLRAAGVPQSVLTKVEARKDRELDRHTFLNGLKDCLGAKDLEKYQGLIMDHAEERFQAATLDLPRLGMVPPLDKFAAPAPQGSPARPQAWWDDLWQPPAVRSPDADEADLYLRLFILWAKVQAEGNTRVWSRSQLASAFGQGALGGFGDQLWARVIALGLCEEALQAEVDAPSPSVLDKIYVLMQKRYLAQLDDAPPGYLYAALRAARRAVASNPEDPLAYLRLGRAYTLLSERTRDRISAVPFTHLRRLRVFQSVAALRRAVELEPDLLEAHEALFFIYSGLNHQDRALEHLRHMRRLLQRRAPQSADMDDRLAGLARSIDSMLPELEANVGKETNSFEANTSKMKPLDRAKKALQHGLGEKALEVLLAQKDIAAAGGREAVEVELEEMMFAGRGADLRTWWSPKWDRLLGDDRFQWWRAVLAATNGEYDEADSALALASPLEQPIGLQTRLPPSDVLPLVLARAVLDRMPPVLYPNAYFGQVVVEERQREVSTEQVRVLAALMQRHTDIQVLRAALALEKGDTAKARALGTAALAVWKSERPTGHTRLDFSGRVFLQHLLSLIGGG
jgi:hypothetical protein